MPVEFKKGDDQYIIWYNGEQVGYINKGLCEKQGLSEDTIRLICETHSVKRGIIEDMHNTNDKQELRNLAANIEEIEFTLQRLWGFPEDRNYHRWWNVPKCSCSTTIDNMERMGTPYRVVNNECPIHGEQYEKTNTTLTCF